MTRALIVIALFAGSALAQAPTPTPAAPPLPSMNYKVSLGGLNAGTFSSFTIPSLSIVLAGNDVLVQATTNAVDKRPIQLLNGKVSAMAKKVLADKKGQQMTVTVQITPLGVKPGQRCNVLLEYAFLRSLSDASITLEASGVPEINCTKPPAP